MCEESFEEFVVFDGLFLIVAPDASSCNHVAIHFFCFFLRRSSCVRVDLSILIHAGFSQFRLEVISLRGFGGLLFLLLLKGCWIEFAISSWCGFIATVCCLVFGLF